MKCRTWRNPTKIQESDGGKGSPVVLVNTPLGSLQAETSTNISIITEKKKSSLLTARPRAQMQQTTCLSS